MSRDVRPTLQHDIVPTLRMSDADVLQSFHWELLDHRLCGFDLVLPDCDLCGSLNEELSCEVGTNASWCFEIMLKLDISVE
jgi:hypothetical protein